MPADEGVESDSLLSRVVRNQWIPPGLFFIAVGTAALVISRGYPLGNLNRMGPGFFPWMLSFAMIGLGVVIVLKGVAELAAAGGLSLPRRRFDRSIVLIPASMAVFGLSIEPLGLVAALALTIAVAGAAHRQAGLKEVAASIVFLVALSFVIFILVLKLPLRVWPSL
jgi:hypothetical protein